MENVLITCEQLFDGRDGVFSGRFRCGLDLERRISNQPIGYQSGRSAKKPT